MNLSTVETERDFYFEKLRGIEVMLQVYKEQEEERGDNNGDGEMMKRVIDKIFKVMYAAAEDNVVVDDDGNVSFVCEERECVYRGCVFHLFDRRSHLCRAFACT